MTVQLNGIGKHYATRQLFENVTLKIGEGSRIGLIGRNGCGKSTLLKIIMGQIDPEEGSVYRAPHTKVNYLTQEPRINPELTLEEEMRTVFSTINALKEKENELGKKLEASASLSEDEMLSLLKKLDNLHQEMDRLGVHTMDARIGKILQGLGFTLADYQRKTGEYSGGWQMRINLAKVLLEGADILLLDEPTNHLDLEACEWLENFLINYPGGLVIVSHDRRFLDRVTTETAELELGQLTLWPGNYSTHLELKQAAQEQQQSAYDRQQKELAKQTAFVDRFRASATRSTQAKSREKQLAKIERLEAPDQDNRYIKFRFPLPETSGKHVLTFSNVGKSFGDKSLFQKLNADISRGQRIFLLGENGCGKTTLMRLIQGLESLDTGEITPGYQVNMGYFSQNQLDTLNPALNSFETMQEACPKLNNTELRTLLGRFLITGDEVFKPISVLSGGEKSKVALAKLLMSGANFLLLDEPTNHMDMPAKDAITNAFLDYEGTMLCISHDRHFIQTLATEIWEIYHGQLLTYCGDYDYYLFKRDEIREQAMRKIKSTKKAAPQKAEAPVKQELNSSNQAIANKNELNLSVRKEQEKQFKKIEKQILKLETEIEALQQQLLEPSIQQDYQTLNQLASDVEKKQAELATLNTEWESLSELLAEG